MKLKISDALSIPLDAVTETFAVMGIRGSGKTHTASVMAEEMLTAGQPIVVYDPTGAWFGLKTSADGKRPGFPVVIFGGEHPDLPLEESAGEMIAKVIVEKRFSVILDVSLLRKGARIRFMQDFCETLYHKNRQALHFFVDEAHTIAPQKAFPEVTRVLGAMEDIVLQGRRRGLGLTVISQRPALVNTNIRTQCSTLIAMRIVGPHDRKAIEEWTEAHGTPERTREMMTSLATLGKGEGWVWSVWLDLFKKLRFRQRETFDSSATPEVGKTATAPKVVAEIDLAKLGEEIQASAQRAKESDPRELKRRIAELEKQLRERPAATLETIVEKIVEVPVLKNGQLEKTEKTIERTEVLGQRLIEAAGELRRLIAPAFAGANQATPARPISPPNLPPRRPAPAPVPRQRPAPTRPISPPSRPSPAPAPRPLPAATAGDDGKLSGPEQKILDAIAWLESIGIQSPEQTAVAFLAGYTIGGGAFNNPKGALRTKGLIEYMSGNCVMLTDAGREMARKPDAPLTPEELHEMVLARLPGPEKKILSYLLSVYPNDAGNEEVASATGYAVGGGAFNNPKGRLRTLGLIEYPAPQRLAARSILFLE
jgi:uncharacterized protein